MPNWDQPDVIQWKGEAGAQQQEYYLLLGDREYDKIDQKEWTILRQKVGFGIYGPPTLTPDQENKFTGYGKKELDHVQKICDKISDNNGGRVDRVDTFMACLFVTGKIWEDRFTIPVFKICQPNNSPVFVDTDCRVYKSWADYLSSNKLPTCMYCYPRDGIYEAGSDDKVLLEFGTSPACNWGSRILSFLDTTTTVVTLGATAVGIAALCTIPIAGPIAAGAAAAGIVGGTYGAARSGYTLIDRGAHDQSIGLDDAEARGCWLSIFGSILGVAQGRFIASMQRSARAGEIMGKAGRIAYMVVNTGSLTVNGIGIAHGLAALVDKHERNELTPLDIFQFSASVLFFTNSVVSLKTAGTIIKEVQKDTIGAHRDSLDTKAAKKLFDKQTGKLRGPREMHGNARVIKALNRIENKNELYSMMTNSDVNNARVRLTPDGFKGLLVVNGQLKVHPNKFFEMGPEARNQVFDQTKLLAKGDISKADFTANMKQVCKAHRINFEFMRKETLQNLCKAFDCTEVSQIKVGNRSLFAQLKPHEIDRLSTVMTNTGKNYDPAILEIATNFAEARGCNSVNDFCSYMEFACLKLAEKQDTYETNYQAELRVAKTKPNFKEQDFNKSQGIEGKRAKYFQQKVLQDFQNGTAGCDVDSLSKNFEHVKSQVSPLNHAAHPGFFSDNAATYHYLKHSYFGDHGQLSPEGYFKIASELVGSPANQTNSMLSQEGSCTFVTFKDPRNGAFAVKIDRIQDGQIVSGIATVMYDRNVLKP